MKKKELLLLALVAIFDVLFYQQQLGLNVFVFSIVLIITSLIQRIDLVFNFKWQLYSVSLVLAALCTLFYGDFLSVFTTLISITMLASLFIDKQSSVIVSFANAALTYVCSPYTIIKTYIHQIGNWNTKKDKYGIVKIELSVLVIAITLIFFYIYRSSNVFFYSFTKNINLDFISFSFILFTLNAILLLYSFFNIKKFVFFYNYIDKPQKTIVLYSDSENNDVNSRLTLELFTGRLLLILLNFILFIVNILDFNFFINRNLPSGISYSEFVHQGVGLLIFSIFLAISIILYLFRGNLNYHANTKLLRVLAYIWVVQNTFIVVSIILRNSMYINAMGLTEKRIGVYVYLLLSSIGLILTLIKVKKAYTNAFYIRSLSTIFFIIMLIACPINWDTVIAKYNLKRKDAMQNFNYLTSLSSSTIPVLDRYIKNSKIMLHCDSIVNQQNKKDLDRVIYNFLENYYQKRSWQSYMYSNYLVYNYIQEASFCEFLLSSTTIGKGEILNHLKGLNVLRLENCTISNNFNLYKLSELTRLELINCNVTSLNFVYQLPKLEYLDISGNTINKLVPLYSLKNLKILIINKTNEQNIRYLKYILPHTQIQFK